VNSKVPAMRVGVSALIVTVPAAPERGVPQPTVACPTLAVPPNTVGPVPSG